MTSTKARPAKGGEEEVHRFERRLAHSPEKVFRALTDEAELAEWFPAVIEGPREEGGALRFHEREGSHSPREGVIQVFEPPTRLVYTWGDQTLNWELSPVPGGCLLVLTTTRSSSGTGSAPLALAA